MNKDDLKKYIPFEKKQFRPGQFEAIQQTMEAIENGDRYIILNAPVGVGKSLIGYVLAKKLLELNGSDRTYMYTKTKMLQDQYVNDFADVRLVKGRSNFFCENEPVLTCSNGMCQTMGSFNCHHKPVLKEKWEFDDMELPEFPIQNEIGDLIFYGDEEFDRFYTSGMCPYWKQKIEGIMHPITMLNYNYAISDSRFVQQLPYRKLGIYDEAHNIEQIIMSELEYRFSPSVVESETQFKLTNHRLMDDWIDDIEEIAKLYKGSIKGTEVNKKKWQDKYEFFRGLLDLLEDNPSNWVCTQDTERGHLFYIFKPIKVNEYTHMVFSQNQHCLLMTGTVLKPDIFARDLGIDDYTYIEIPSIVPIENRPIVKMYVGSMARSSIDATMPNMVLQIKLLAEKHQSEKGLIHTFTYNIANRLKQALKSDNRFIFHNQKNKDRRFKEFKKNKTNKILVSPVAFEGIDFPYDEARWQCICKDPFPNIGDPQVRVRDATDYGWLFRQRCLVLSQMYGRTNRAADDYSVTYLMDSRLDTLLGPATLVTDYFLEALEGFNYNQKLILAEDAYDRLTKDNKRKSHEVDRFQELAILDAIKDEGLDSLHKLRSAYKNMQGDSYALVIPAVQRLIKNGAIL